VRINCEDVHIQPHFWHWDLLPHRTEKKSIHELRLVGMENNLEQFLEKVVELAAIPNLLSAPNQ